MLLQAQIMHISFKSTNSASDNSFLSLLLTHSDLQLREFQIGRDE